MAVFLFKSDKEEADNSDRPDLIRLPLLASATVDRMNAFSLIHALSPLYYERGFVLDGFLPTYRLT